MCSITVEGRTFTFDAQRVEQALALETHSTEWRPAGATLARLVDQFSPGIDGGVISRHDVGKKLQSLAASRFIYLNAVAGGLSDVAAINGAALLVGYEALAAAGSEAAAVAVQAWSDRLALDGLSEKAFARARSQLVVD